MILSWAWFQMPSAHPSERAPLSLDKTLNTPPPQVCYLLYFNAQQEPGKKTWGGWSRECFAEWGVYVRVAIPSMVMICLDWWTFEVGG